MLLKLADTFFRNSFIVNKKKNKQYNPYLSICLLGLIFAAVAGGGTAAYYLTIGKGQPPHNIVIIVMVALSLLTIILSFFQMHTTLFHTKDFNSLASLPLSNKTIVMAKLLSVFFYDFIIDIIAMLPVLILYMVFGGTGIGLFIGIVGTIFLDFIPLAFVTLIALIVCVITAKSKYGGLISVLLYAVIFIGLTVAVALIANNADIMASLPKALPYFQFMVKAYNGDLLSLLWFVLISLGGIAITILLSIFAYTPINQMKTNVSAKEYSLGQAKGKSGLGHVLFKKEVDLVIHNPMFLLSTYLIPVLALVLALVFFGISKGFGGQTPEGLKALSVSLRLVYIIFALIFAGLCSTTFASFSLEGNNFKMLFAYPLNKEEIIKAKIKASIIPLSLIFTVSGVILIVVEGILQGFNNITYSMWIANLLIPVLGVSVSSLIGTLVGLRYIKLDYVNTNDIFKKSKAYGFAALYGSIANIVALAGYIALMFVMSPDKNPLMDLAVTGIITAYYAVVIIVLSYFISIKGVKLFNKAIQ